MASAIGSWAGGHTFLRACRVAVGNGPRRQTVQGRGLCGEGLRRKTAPVAATTRDYKACSGLWRLALLCRGFPVRDNVGRRRKLLLWPAGTVVMAVCLRQSFGGGFIVGGDLWVVEQFCVPYQ